jgi:phospholipid/cholesterol/gamma-HCH transport system ATP-binding protein
MKDSQDIISIRSVCKNFNGQRVLDGVDLDIKRGETLVIIGCSGCGKSVLLKTIIGILKPDSGQIFIDGTDIVPLNEHEMDKIRLRFGMLFQGAALFDSLNVWENIAFSFTEHSKMSYNEMDAKVKECLELVGLPGIEAKFPAELSGGMKKRVGLARAIANQPQILLFDEPTTGLDPIMSDAIDELIVNLRDKLKITCIAVTHDMKSAQIIGDRIAMLYNGKIARIISTKDIMTSRDPLIHQFVIGSARHMENTSG